MAISQLTSGIDPLSTNKPVRPMAQPPAGIGQMTEQQQKNRAMAAQLQATRQGAGRLASNALGSAQNAMPAAMLTVPARQAWGMATGGETPFTFTHELPYQQEKERYMRGPSAEEQAKTAQTRQQIAEMGSGMWARAAGDRLSSPPAIEHPAQVPLRQESLPQDAGRLAAMPAAGEDAASEAGPNLAQELTARARMNTPPTAVANRIIREGNSFRSNQRIGPGATIGSTDTLQAGQQDDGRAMGNINTYSSADVIERGMRASQIRDLTRLEQSNPNRVSVVYDETRKGFEGELNRRRNERARKDEAARSEQHRQAVAQGRQNILDGLSASRAQQSAEDERAYNRNYTQQKDARAEQRALLGDQLTRQQIEQGGVNLAQQQQLSELRQRVVDPALTPEQRAEAERAYQSLTTPARDRYMLQDVIMGQTDTGSPITGKAALDTLTGQMVSQNTQASQAPRTKEQAIAAAKDAVAGGASRAKVNQRLKEEWGEQI